MSSLALKRRTIQLNVALELPLCNLLELVATEEVLGERTFD